MGKAVRFPVRITLTIDPQYKGDTGLVVVSSNAVDSVDITVQDRETRLQKLGIPKELINSAGNRHIVRWVTLWPSERTVVYGKIKIEHCGS